MENILYSRKEGPGGSLLVQAICESGHLRKYKFPGILKSKKRSSLFLEPGTVWDITVSGNPREIMTPKEFSLLVSPFNMDVSYRELYQIGELLKPMPKLKSTESHQNLFQILKDLISKWKALDKAEKEIAVNGFYLNFLNEMGLLNFSEFCLSCSREIEAGAFYLLNEGSLCAACRIKVPVYEEFRLPAAWIQNTLNQKTDSAPELSAENRNKILKFLEVNI